MSSYSISCFYLSLVLQICGIFFFFTGFLPVSPISNYQGDASSKTCNRKARVQNATHTEDRADGKKLVLMVVDALREDFVFKGNSMPFLQRLIKDKKTIRYVRMMLLQVCISDYLFWILLISVEFCLCMKECFMQ